MFCCNWVEHRWRVIHFTAHKCVVIPKHTQHEGVIQGGDTSEAKLVLVVFKLSLWMCSTAVRSLKLGQRWVGEGGKNFKITLSTFPFNDPVITFRTKTQRSNTNTNAFGYISTISSGKSLIHCCETMEKLVFSPIQDSHHTCVGSFQRKLLVECHYIKFSGAEEPLEHCAILHRFSELTNTSKT